MEPDQPEPSSTQRSPSWKLWQGLAALTALSSLFALLAALGIPQAIGAIVAGLMLLAVQALLLLAVTRWLRK